MAFRRKAEYILHYKPDLLIVPECEHPSKLKFPSNISLPNDVVWYGANLNKGLGVFSYSDYRFKLLDAHNPDLKTILPIEVTSETEQFILFAIWANNPLDRDNQYIEQVWKALHHYQDLIRDEKTLLIGDFNSNTIWDRKNRVGNHSAVVDWLQAKGIHSVYHRYFDCSQGKELHPTLSLYRHQDRPYHIDYCFASSDFISLLSNVEVGSYEQWHIYSDHKPLVVEFGL